MKHTYYIMLALACFVSFHAQAAQSQTTHHHAPSIAAFGLAGAGFLGSYALMRKHDAMLEQYSLKYNAAAIRTGNFTHPQSQENTVFPNRMKEKGIDENARNRYKYASYGLCLFSLLPAGIGCWLWFKNSNPKK